MDWQKAATATCFVTFNPTNPQRNPTRNNQMLIATQATSPSIHATLNWSTGRRMCPL